MTERSLDVLVAEARAAIERTGDASSARLARELRIGWNRAAAIVEKIEAEGLVSRQDAKGRRNVRSGDGELLQPAGKPSQPWEAVAATWIERFGRWRRGQRG